MEKTLDQIIESILARSKAEVQGYTIELDPEIVRGIVAKAYVHLTSREKLELLEISEREELALLARARIAQNTKNWVSGRRFSTARSNIAEASIKRRIDR